MNELDPAHFLSPTGLAWQAYLKKTEVKLYFYRIFSYTYYLLLHIFVLHDIFHL